MPKIGEGFAAYASGDWDGAIRQFERAVPQTVRIGGSCAPHDLVEHTLLAAYLKAGRPNAARQLITRRTDRRATVMVAGLYCPDPQHHVEGQRIRRQGPASCAAWC